MQFLKRLVVALACALTLGLACLLALLIQNPETEEMSIRGLSFS